MKTVKSLAKYMKGSYGLIALSLLLALASVGAKMAIPFVTGLAIDCIKNGNYDVSVHLFVCAGLLAVGALFRYAFDVSVVRIGQTLVKRMRDELFKALHDVPLSYIDRHERGDLLLRLINDIENVQTGLITGAGALYEGAVQILVTVVFMFVLNWILALVVIVLTPISVVVSRFISNHNSRYFKKQNEMMGKLTAYTLESITNLETIQSFGGEENRIATFEESNEEARKASFKASFAASWINPMTRVVNNAIYASVILIGALIIIHDVSLGFVFTVGGLSSFITYSYQYMTPFNEIADAANDVLYATASFHRIEETIEAPKDVDEGKTSLGETIETLEAKDIHFSYDGKREIIKGFDLDIYKGHKIALVGPTGCGKTTIINLLMRFYDAQEGGFSMNGIKTVDAPKPEMRSHIGMVLQETWLKKGTIRENIAYGKPEASLDEVIVAAKKAHAHDFITRLKDGYDTVVSNASGLSTGEKQLLCVARIMLLQPEIVMLDEATSNIDLRTELNLSKAFDELMNGKTSLVVAHRLSTIKNADLIVVLKDGEILEQGNFEELMQAKGFFFDLYNSQLA